MKEIIEILKNYKFTKKEFFTYVIIGIIAETLMLTLPKLTGDIISKIEQNVPVEEFYKALLIFAFFSLFTIFLNFLHEYYGSRLWILNYAKKAQYYREKLFEKNYKTIIDVGTGKLMTRFGEGLNAEIDIFTGIISILISAVFRGILVIVVLYLFVPTLTLFLILGIVVLLTINNYGRKNLEKVLKIEQEFWEQNGRIKARMIMENLVIRVFGKIDYELEKSKKVLDEVPHYVIKIDKINNIIYKLLELLLRLLEIGVFLVIGLMVYNGTQDIAYLVMVSVYVWFLWWPLDKAISNLNKINRVWEKYIKLKKFIDEPVDIIDGDKEYEFKVGKIEFKNLGFSYDNKRHIFDNFNLNLMPGKTNALIGHSGGGKTTITKLILRLYDYEKGDILIDGQDFKKLKINSIYKHIGYLPQESSIFDGTIRENLEYSLDIGKVYGDEVLWEALKKSRVDDLIKKLDKGLDTEVGEKGIKLSGGEKQRLAIARIFLKNPEIIILDEPTSALDSISEAKITKTLNELMKGKTSIIIAHRLQTVMNADNIIIIEDGKIESEGKHEELLQKSEIYKKLVDLQNGRIVD